MNIQAPGDNAQPPVADDKRLLTMDERNGTRPQSGSGGQTAPLRLYLIRHGISRLARHRSQHTGHRPHQPDVAVIALWNAAARLGALPNRTHRDLRLS